MSDPIKQFWDLCSQAKRVWETIPDTKKFEPFLLDILDHVKRHREFHEEFKRCFIQIIDDPTVAPWEVVMYGMRELKWKEVYDVAHEKYIESEDVRIKDVMKNIMAVFDNEWEDSDLYKYYSNQ